MNHPGMGAIFGRIARRILMPALLCGCQAAAQPSSGCLSGEDRYPTKREVIAALKGSGDYLVRHLKSDGSFVYKYDPIARRVSRSYNILRHAGTAYALLGLYQYTRDPDLLGAAEHSLAYLHRQIVPCPDLPEAACVVEKNEIKLGGNALAILAFVKHSEVTNKEKYLQTAWRLAQFIVRTQSADGRFFAHKVLANSGQIASMESSYYPGEALFALAELGSRSKDRSLLGAAHRGARWLIQVRDGGKSIANLEHDHWLLYALNELYADAPNNLYVDHARKLVDAISSAQHWGLRDGRQCWNGGYYFPPRSTPTAVRSEGVAAAMELFSRAGDDQYRERARTTLARGIAYQLRTQLTREAALRIKADEAAVGGFQESLEEYSIRIDYVQHNISALLAYMRLD